MPLAAMTDVAATGVDTLAVAIGSSHAMLTRDAVASEVTRLLGLLSDGRRR
jgi:fructose/tagatose bisphosphate aldolase